MIVGQLFDPATGYAWTQEMKSSFPNMHLLTSQGVGHVLSRFEDPVCFRYVLYYLITGDILFNDGEVCEKGPASDEDFREIFGVPTPAADETVSGGANLDPKEVAIGAVGAVFGAFLSPNTSEP